MPSIRTRFFGTAEYAMEDITTFPGGIPPFVHCTHFVLMSYPAKQPLVFLQSVDDETLCFIAMPVRVLVPDYELAVEEQDLSALGWPTDKPPTTNDLVCLAILTIPERGAATANLLAPVLINTAARLGVQAVRSDTVYTHAQPLEEQAHEGAPAC